MENYIGLRQSTALIDTSVACGYIMVATAGP